MQSTQIADGFKAYKTNGLPEIEAKERDYFKRGLEGVLRLLYQAPASFTARERIEFLARDNFKVAQQDRQHFITHEGKQDERFEIARRLKQKGVAIEIIAETTELTKEQVEKL